MNTTSILTTDKQARYLMILLQQNGYSTNYMDAGFRRLGATMRERSGRVDSWVRNLGIARAAALIDQLKKPEPEPAPRKAAAKPLKRKVAKKAKKARR
jgi:hypothetical protein